MYKIQIGIEHFACGLQIIPTREGQIIQTQHDATSGGSMFTLVSDATFQTQWRVVKDGRDQVISMFSSEDDEAKEASPAHWNVVKHWAHMVASVMDKAMHFPSPDIAGHPLTNAVVLAMIKAHGYDARFWISRLRRSPAINCWLYEYNGMMIGVEEDGTRHT